MDRLPLTIKITAKMPIIIELTKSKITIDFFLSNQSPPKTPAIGENNNLGKIDIDIIEAKW